MEEILALANKLGGVSFATLLLFILYGSWKHIWLWGKDVEAAIAKEEARVIREKQAIYEDRDFWRNIAIRATGLAEVQGQILRVKETGKLDDVNG